MRKPTLRNGPQKIDFSSIFSRKRDHTDSFRKGPRYYKYSSFAAFSMITRHTKTHLKLHPKGTQNSRKNDEKIIEKTKKTCSKMQFLEKGAKNSSQAALGHHFGRVWGVKSTPKPPPNGLKWAADEGHAPALLASGSRSRPAETEKTRP